MSSININFTNIKSIDFGSNPLDMDLVQKGTQDSTLISWHSNTNDANWKAFDLFQRKCKGGMLKEEEEQYQ